MSQINSELFPLRLVQLKEFNIMPLWPTKKWIFTLTFLIHLFKHSVNVGRFVVNHTHTHIYTCFSWWHTQALRNVMGTEAHQSPYLLRPRQLRERNKTQRIVTVTKAKPI